MYIRRVPTRNITTGDSYFTHRLVRTERIGNRVRQVTLLNLGRHFAVAQEDWPALGEILEFDFEGMSLMRLYRASDLLLHHQGRIEAFVFERVRSLFSLESTVTLYDLTNTYFEGALKGNPKAARGHSKEQRTECPLLTLGLVLDASGFVRRSQVFAGNAVEARTLDAMLKSLQAPAGALVVMDRGIATEQNLAWLKAQGYRYLVVSRERARQFDPLHAVEISAAGGQRIRLHKVLSPDAQEVRLYCHSPGREQKEVAIVARLTQRFEQGLAKLCEGLAKPRGEKRLVKITERIGRLKQRCRGIGQHYRIEYQIETSGKKLKALTWTKQPVPGTQMSDPGVYCLRSNETSWTPEQLWRTYVTLTDIEAVFRSLKSELGLRPIFHHKQARCDAHLFISVLAYQFVQIIRTRLAERGIHDSWASLRKILQVQRRVTSSFKTRGGRSLNVRKASLPEPELAPLYAALALDPNPGGTKKLIA